MIDNSASMAATDVKPSRLEWARREALKVIDAATEDSVGMVIAFNSKASTLQSYTSNKAKLRDAVNGIRQTNRPTRIEDAILLADSLANPRRSTENVASRPDNVDPAQERTFVQPRGIPTDVYLFSDGGFPDPPESSVKNLNSVLAGNSSALGNLHFHFQTAGKRGPEHVNNVGIVNFSAVRLVEDLTRRRTGREPTRLQVLVQVRNYRAGEPQVLKVRLKATAQGKVLYEDRRLIDLPPRKVLRGEPGKGQPEKDEPGEAPVSFELPPLDLGASTVLHASLEGADDEFPLDDQAWLVVGVVRKARVLIVSPGNPVLDAFFRQPATEKLTKLTRLAPADLGKAGYREAARGGEYDLVIFDRCAPVSEEDMPRANTFFIDRPPPPWQRGARAVTCSVLMVNKKEDNPLLRNLPAVLDVWANDAFRFHFKDSLPDAARSQFNLDGKEPGKRALPSLRRLIEAGGDMPVLFTLPRGGHTDLVMTFPLFSGKGDLCTDWPLEPSFPLFLRNMLLALGNVTEGMRDAAVQPGEPVVLRPEAGVEWLEITPPGGAPEKLTRGRRPDFIYANTDRVGLYQVLRDDGVRHQFAVNLLDPGESNLEPRQRFQVGEDTVAAGNERSEPRELWKWLVLAGLLLLLLEWYVYNRRVHV
jgi:hypothetical protein